MVANFAPLYPKSVNFKSCKSRDSPAQSHPGRLVLSTDFHLPLLENCPLPYGCWCPWTSGLSQCEALQALHNAKKACTQRKENQVLGWESVYVVETIFSRNQWAWMDRRDRRMASVASATCLTSTSSFLNIHQNYEAHVQTPILLNIWATYNSDNLSNPK